MTTAIARPLAAGLLLIREAGGFVSDLDGGEAILTKSNIVAGNENMHRELMRLLQNAAKEHANDPERYAGPSPAKAAATAPGSRGVR